MEKIAFFIGWYGTKLLMLSIPSWLLLNYFGVNILIATILGVEVFYFSFWKIFVFWTLSSVLFRAFKT